MPPAVIGGSAPSACAHAATNASFRTLFPPHANAIPSSRLTNRRADVPRRAASRGIGSTSEGVLTRATVGNAESAWRSSDGVTRYSKTCPMDLLSALKSGASVFAAELRPPRAELAAAEGMDAWIDTYHAVRRLTRQGTFVFLTDSAVGAAEEDNLRHLVTNLGHDAPRDRIVPFLTTKHSIEYCLSYA